MLKLKFLEIVKFYFKMVLGPNHKTDPRMAVLSLPHHSVGDYWGLTVLPLLVHSVAARVIERIQSVESVLRTLLRKCAL